MKMSVTGSELTGSDHRFARDVDDPMFVVVVRVTAMRSSHAKLSWSTTIKAGALRMSRASSALA